MKFCHEPQGVQLNDFGGPFWVSTVEVELLGRKDTDDAPFSFCNIKKSSINEMGGKRNPSAQAVFSNIVISS